MPGKVAVMRVAGQTCLVVLLVCVSGMPASGGAGLPPVAWEGHFIRFATTVDHLPCGRSLEFLDSRVGELIAELEQPALDGDKITYYWLPGHMELSPCPEKADCSDIEERVVYSRTMFHDHELVHVLMRRHGKTHTFLYEGLAEAYGRRGPVLTMEPDKARDAIRRSLSANIDPASIDYPLAGVFSRYLIDEFGLTAYMSIYAKSDFDTDFDSFTTIFTGVLGKTVDDVLALFVDGVPRCYPRTNLCASEPIPWKEDVWRGELGLSCENRGVLEILPGILTNWSVLEVSEPGYYEIMVEGSSDFKADVAIVRCECEPDVTLVSVGDKKSVFLETGSYRTVFGMTVADVADEKRSVSVFITAGDGEQ